LTLKTFHKELLGKEAGREKIVVDIYRDHFFIHTGQGWRNSCGSLTQLAAMGQQNRGREMKIGLRYNRSIQDLNRIWMTLVRGVWEGNWDHTDVVGRHRYWKRDRTIWERRVWITV